MPVSVSQPPRPQAVEPGVDDDRCPIGLGIAGQAGGAHGGEGIGPARRGVDLVLLAGHGRDPLSNALDRPRDARTVGGGHLGVQAEASSLIEVPPLQPPAALGLPHILDRRADLPIGALPHGGARNAGCPRDQPRLALGRREPAELDDLVDAERSPRERLRQRGKVLECVGGADPPARFPGGDAVAHRDPVRQVARSIFSPRSRLVRLEEQRQELGVGGSDPSVGFIERAERVHRTCVRAYPPRQARSVNWLTSFALSSA